MIPFLLQRILNYSLHIWLPLFCASTSLLAQPNEISFKHLSTEDGLSQSTVEAIVQDRYGFMWFGTQDGLNMFDGYTFRVFRNDPQDSNSLSNNFAWRIYEDHTGALWIGTLNGLNLFDRQSETFTRYLSDPQNPSSISSNYIFSICEDRTGALWIGTRVGLNRFDRQSQSFTRYLSDPQNKNSLSVDKVWSSYVDHTGALWIGTGGGGLNLFDRQSNTFRCYKRDPENPNSLSGNGVFSIFEDRTGALWIGTGTGLNLFDRQSQSFRRYKNDPKNPNSLSGNDVRGIYEDRTGALWIITTGGLNLFDRQSQSFRQYQNDPKNPNSLSSDGVSAICEDRSGVLWIGTGHSGLNLFDRQGKSFKGYQNDPENPNSPSSNIVKAIYEDRLGDLWIGTDRGMDLFDRKSKFFRRYDGYVRHIYEDRSGTLWIATGLLGRFDRSSGSFRLYEHDPKKPNSGPFGNANVTYEDRYGALWVGTNGRGLILFDRQSKSFKHFRSDPKNLKTLSNDAVSFICEDRSGVLWVGTGNGLNLFDRQNNSFTRYQNDPKNPNMLSNNNVQFIYEDRLGALWIGTMGGLNLFDRASGVFKHYHEKDGLPNDVISGILEDRDNRLWLSTNKGISRFNPKTGEFRNYDASDGLIGNEFNNGVFCGTRDGMMYFGGIDGLTAFHPDSIRDNPFVPPVVITELLLFNKPVQVGTDHDGFVLPQSVTTADELVLSYREAVFTLEFSALCFANPMKQRYAYQLEGFDKDWVFTDAKRRFATYTNLDPGTYVFHVKGSNHDGIWNEEGRTLRIVITPPWWRTTWAYLGYGLAIIGVLYGIRRSEKNRDRLKHQAEMEHTRAESLQEVDSMKSRFFANISHEFRTPLTLILGPIQKWREKAHEAEEEKDLGMAERNAQRLLRLINQLLDLSKLEAGGMKLQAAAGNIVPFVKGIAQSFQSSAGRRRVELVVEAGDDEIELYFDKDKMEKILTNLLSNAFKFTPEGGKVTVAIKPTLTLSLVSGGPGRGRELVSITVTDTGIGIPPDQLDKVFDRFYQVDASQTREHEGTGIGLALTKELVELHHGMIAVRSEVGKGTEFTVTLPLGRAHLNDDEIVKEGIQESLRAIPISRESEAIPSHAEEIASSVKSAPRNDGKPLVLIVEDNADVREYMKDYLAKDYQVLEAHDGAEGIEKARETIPDLIVSDVMMPKKDGFEVCKTLKLDEKTSHIPIILLTARAGSEDKIEGLETGADDYLTKPFDAKELLVRVKNLIEVRQRLRERFSVGHVLKPGEIAVTSIDDAFLQKVKTVVEENMGKETFSVDDLGKEVAMSRSQLYRKLSALTGQAPSDFIRYMRLHRAMDLLNKNAGTVSEIAYAVGFNSVTYFTRCFRDQFAVLPSEVRKQQHSS